MKSQIIEQFIRSKAGADLTTCEDALVVTPDFVAVIDGATSTTSQKWTAENLTSGQWAAQMLVQGLESLDPEENSTPKEIVDALTRCMRRAYKSEGVWTTMQNQPQERATASILIYSRVRNQLIGVGDCQAALMDRRGEILQVIQPVKYNDQVMSAARAMYLQLELLRRTDRTSTAITTTTAAAAVMEQMRQLASDPGHDFIEPLRVGQRLFQNNPRAPKPYQYWVMDGFPVDEDGIQVYDVPKQTRQVILATDGYPRLENTLEKTEAHLRHVLDTDSLLIGDAFQNTKGVRPGAESFDDRSFVRFALQSKSPDTLQLFSRNSMLSGPYVLIAATCLAALTMLIRIHGGH